MSAQARRAIVRYLRGLTGKRLPARHETGQAVAARGASRGILLTPWFAAGTGFVLAAGMYLYAPHADLSFPNPLQNRQSCLEKGCKSAKDDERLAGTPGARIPNQSKAGNQSGAASKTPASGHRPNPASGLTFGFRVLRQADNMFAAEITVSGKQALASWRLRFIMRGTSNDHVAGASFEPVPAGDGGLATPPSPDDSSGGQGAANSGGPGPGEQQGSDQQSGPGAPIIVFYIYGSGTPHKPGHCRFDGARCAFSVLS
ncbi:MAG TPA: hypothetical protein VGI58_10180 [Streptosporangiaceae bacterium]